MKLDRNINGDGRGKYGLIKNRRLAEIMQAVGAGPACAAQALEVTAAIRMLEAAGVIDWGDEVDTEFFVVKLKDQYANKALHAYAYAARLDDLEYADEVSNLAYRSGQFHPSCKKPD